MNNKVTRRLITVALLLSAVTPAGIAKVHRGRSTMKGKIIAYRPAERMVQMASQVLNTEYFLFKVNAGNNSAPQVIKLKYEHFGFSRFGDDVLTRTPTLQLKVDRDNTCDETYGEFVENSPAINEEQGKGEASEKVTFIGAFQKEKPSNGQMLKCYKLHS